MKLEAITETFDGLISVSEMTSDPAALVALSPGVVATITAGDDDPKFATFVIEPGWSKSKRYWGPELFGEVASEINAAAVDEPIVGYLGHIKPENDPYEFPPIQLQWAGAKMLGEKLAAKAYILPGTTAREYFEHKRVKSVSWRGKIAQELYQQGVRVKKFAIESIDIARPRSAGMSARLVGALTSEMETEEEGGGVKPEEIAALTPNELRAHNPGLVQTIEVEAKQPLETKVSEMETDAAAVQPVTAEIPTIRQVLGLADDTDDVTVLKSVIEYVRAQGKSIREALLDKVLKTKKLDGDDPSVKMARRIIVGEITNFTATGDSTKDEQTVTEMVNRVIDGDEQLKEIVSEMEGTPPAVPEGGSSERTGGKRDLKPGLKTSTIRVRSLNR
jgi:hypothetical protein